MDSEKDHSCDIVPETGESLDVNDSPDVENNNNKSRGKRKAPERAVSACKKAKKWAWTPEAAEMFLNYIKEYKTKCDFNGVDFEADLTAMYTEARRCMAVGFPDNFRPEYVHEPGKELKDMGSEEYESYRKRIEEEKQKIKLGYQRVKEKAKSVRQDYRNAVNKGTRSGSGKVVQDNYDLLTDIWGGSPSTMSLSFGIDGEPGETAESSGTTSELDEASEGE